jgi:hypothetical protein
MCGNQCGCSNKLGGGSYKCSACGETVFGSVECSCHSRRAADKERSENRYMYMAIRRNKDNEGSSGKELCCREVDKTESESDTVDKLKARIRSHPGVWRIYRSVNKRNLVAGRNELVKFLGENPSFLKSIDSKWKSILMTQYCKSTRYKLLDLDTKEPKQLADLLAFLARYAIKTYEGPIETPNGYHIVCHGFDQKLLSQYENEIGYEIEVDVKGNDQLYIESITVPVNPMTISKEEYVKHANNVLREALDLCEESEAARAHLEPTLIEIAKIVEDKSYAKLS